MLNLSGRTKILTLVRKTSGKMKEGSEEWNIQSKRNLRIFSRVQKIFSFLFNTFIFNLVALFIPIKVAGMKTEEI